MAQKTSPTEQVWADLRALPAESRVALLQLLLTNEELRAELEDASDLLEIAERRDEPTRPWDEMMDKLRARERAAVSD